MFHCRSEPALLFAPVVETGFPVPFTVPSGPSVTSAVVVSLLFVIERVVLCVYELMLFRLDGYADMFIPCIETDLDRLCC